MDPKYIPTAYGFCNKMDEFVSRQHHGGNMSSSHLDNDHKVQAENDYLRDRVHACEKGINNIYQIIQRRQSAVRSVAHYRSASLTYGTENLSPGSTLDRGPHVESSMGLDIDDMFPVPRMVTIAELRETVEKLVLERDQLSSQVDDLKQVTEAAKRERVLAIDEKDHLLREAHSLKMSMDKSESSLKSCELERRQLANQLRGMEEEMKSLQRASEEARRMRALALEERAKLLEDRNQLQCELSTLQGERDIAYQENTRLQTSLKEMSRDKGRLVQELDWLSKRTTGYEAVARTLKEQNTVLNGQICDNFSIKLERCTANQPWGFGIEGGTGSEFYHDDPSIVITSITEKTPAYGRVRFGDRIITVNDKDFTNISRREATDVLRSCDQLAITMEIGRITSHVKPLPQEVKLPGKKSFGFTSEMRLFVSSVEEGSTAAELLTPGDEIVQVLGKSAVNMKLSHFKQVLKSCKDGLSLTIQRQPGSTKDLAKPTSSSTPHSPSASRYRVNSRGSSNRLSLVQQQRTSGETTQHSFQAPGTPGSTISETSAGYHSLTHSMPSVASNVLSPDMKTGQTTLTEREGEEYKEETLGNQQQQQHQSTHQLGGSRGELADTATSMSSRIRTGSASSPGLVNYVGTGRSSLRSRPRELYTRRNTTMYSQRQSNRPRAVSQSSFGTSHTGLGSPKRPESCTRFSYKGSSLPHGLQPPTTPTYTAKHAPIRPVFSMSADNLDSDSCFPPTTPRSHDGHMTRVTTPCYSRGGFSVSMGSMQTHV